MNKQEIAEALFHNFNSSCGSGTPQLPGRLGFAEQDGTVTMTMAQADLAENMQGDNSCFEGWACVLKAWLYHMPALKVRLAWEPLQDPNNGHYQRFLYRAKRFSELYGHWFSIADPVALGTLRILDGEDAHYTMNAPAGERPPGVMPNAPLDTMSEKDLEQAILSPGRVERLMALCCLQSLEHKLPVGVFEGEILASNRIFTGGASAVDLWGLGSGGDKAHIFEAKKAGAVMVGILSELFFYAAVIRDLQRGKFTQADPRLAPLANTNKLRADILCPHAHPLLDRANGRVFSVLNRWRPDDQNLDLQFGWIEISQTADGLRFSRVW